MNAMLEVPPDLEPILVDAWSCRCAGTRALSRHRIGRKGRLWGLNMFGRTKKGPAKASSHAEGRKIQAAIPRLDRMERGRQQIARTRTEPDHDPVAERPWEFESPLSHLF